MGEGDEVAVDVSEKIKEEEEEEEEEEIYKQSEANRRSRGLYTSFNPDDQILTVIYV